MIRIAVTGGSGFIGTNFIDLYSGPEVNLINIDIRPPKKPLHRVHWREGDILDFHRLLQIFDEFRPTHVVHLAARTDTLSEKLDDYDVNTKGTVNVLECVKAMATAPRLIVTSTQFVFAPPGLPRNDEDYNPIGAYGLSKVLAEKATRSCGLTGPWTITRPTNIWGPWHPRYPSEFWSVLKKGLYFHPSGRPAMRSYGYVRNVVHQMRKILEAPPALVDEKVYYLGDPPIPLIDWVNGFALAITGKPTRTAPRWLLKSLAAMGTIVARTGIRFPITLSRYRSMTEDYFSPMETTIRVLGSSPYSLEEGIRETVDWLNHYWNGSL